MKRAIAALAAALILGLGTGVRAEVQEGWVFPAVTPEKNVLHIQGPAGEYFTFEKTCRSTMGHYVVAPAIIPPGAGPLPHVHHWTDEWFYFPDGGITIEMGEHQYPTTTFIPGANAPKDKFHLIKTKPGDLFYGPKYIIHGFFNNDTKPHNLIFVWAPDDGLTDYFREVGQRVGDDPNKLPPIAERNKQLFVTQAPKYGINQSSKYNQYISSVDYTTTMTMDPHRGELEKLLTTTYTTPAKTHVPCK